jgi:hypothetical protein
MAHLANKYFNDISHADVANTKCERSAHTAATNSTALAKIGNKAVAADGLATEFATVDNKSEQNQQLTLWRR